MSLINIENEHYRRDILQLLEQDADCEINEIVLHSALRGIGNPIAHDRLKTQLHWLEDQALISLRNIGDSNVLAARLTTRGLDVAVGDVVVPMVARKALD